MNWHEPLITPATAFYCVVGWLAIEALIWIVRRVIAEGKSPDDGHEMIPPDWEKRSQHVSKP